VLFAFVASFMAFFLLLALLFCAHLIFFVNVKGKGKISSHSQRQQQGEDLRSPVIHTSTSMVLYHTMLVEAANWIAFELADGTTTMFSNFQLPLLTTSNRYHRYLLLLVLLPKIIILLRFSL
jgi:hypothetical protein